MPASPPSAAAQHALSAYLVQSGLLPASAFACAPVAGESTEGAAETLVAALAQVETADADAESAARADARDWHRNFGLHLLPRDDPAFSDPAYLLASLRSAGPDDPGWRSVGEGPRSSELVAWILAWKALAPAMDVVGFAQTGSDAIGICFDVARRCGRGRLHLAGMSQTEALAKNPGLAFFAGSFGGGRGEAAGMNTLFSNTGAPNLSAWCLPDCAVTNPDDLSAAQAAVLSQNEAAALERLEQQAQDVAQPLGALYLEVIQGARGAYFFRRPFLAALRAWGDRYGVPIVDDEVLSVARTGRFFAFEHYAPDFEPDFVAFGKGLELAGLARVQRGARTLPCMRFLSGHLGFVTARYPSRQQLLKSRQILLAIAQRQLLAQSEASGAALVAGLRALEESMGLTPVTTGKGLLVGTSHLLGLCALPGAVSLTTASERPRLLPPITLDLGTVRAVLAEARQCLFDPDAQLALVPVPRGMPEVESLANPSAATTGSPYRR